MLIFIYLPVATLVLFSFHDGRVPVPPFQGPTIDWYVKILGNPRINRRHGELDPRRHRLLGDRRRPATLAGWGLARHKIPGRR